MTGASSLIGKRRIVVGGPYTATELVNTNLRTPCARLAARRRMTAVMFCSAEW
jgi:hypothetical protein